MYDELKAALDSIEGLPFAENEWATRPTTDFGTYQLDFDATSDEGDGEKLAQAVEGSVDLFSHYPMSHTTAKTEVAAIESVLREHCGPSWYKNSIQYEHETGLMHIEWVFQLEAI